jgi:hypothetical protein
MTLVLICGIVGATLGLRYKVLVLLPVICAALAIVVLDAGARGDGFWPTVLIAVGAVTCLQLGYVLGRAIVVAIETARPGAHDQPTQRPPSEGFWNAVGTHDSALSAPD